MKKSLLNLILCCFCLVISACEMPSHRLNVRGYAKNNKFEYRIRENRNIYNVKVIVPPYLADKYFKEEILIFGPAMGPRGKIAVAAAWSGDSAIGIESTTFVGDEITITLRYTQSIASLAQIMGAGELSKADGLFEKPNHYPTMARDIYPSVGRLQTAGERYAWGLLGFSGACTATLVGKRVALTNAHCVHTKEDCAYTKVTFSDYNEKNRFGQKVSREYECSQIIYSSFDYDMTLFYIDGSPAEHYPVQKLDLRPLEIQNGAWLFMIGATPNRENKHLEICQVKSDLRVVGGVGDKKFRYLTKMLVCGRKIMGGDSGSPVFNQDGNIVGVVWGSSSTAQSDINAPDLVAMTPLWIMGAAFNDPRHRIFRSYIQTVEE